MPKKLSFVTDFDGTVTDAQAEAIPFVEKHTQLLAEKVGLNSYEMHERILVAQEQVQTQPEGFPRPVLLRRNAYNDILQRLGGPHYIIRGIAGDIFELDLALPDQRGIQTFHLAQTAPLYERDFYNGGMRHRADILPGLLQLIKDTR
jgi:hypothetical protein